MSRVLGILFLMSGILLSCSVPKVHNDVEYLGWINQDTNGLIKEKEVGAFKVSIKHLPAEYLSIRECKQSTNCDSIKSLYKDNLTFLVTIGPGDKEKFDLMSGTVGSYEEYQQRVYKMNFDMTENFSLNVGGKNYSPVLCKMENVYGMSPNRKLNLVFSSPELKTEKLSGKLDLKFNDDFLGMGINHFVFEAADFKKVPEVIY